MPYDSEFTRQVKQLADSLGVGCEIDGQGILHLDEQGLRIASFQVSGPFMDIRVPENRDRISRLYLQSLVHRFLGPEQHPARLTITDEMRQLIEEFFDRRLHLAMNGEHELMHALLYGLTEFELQWRVHRFLQSTPSTTQGAHS